mmetsp:Transcript_20204/g.44930  ORF Transcript_20204/g.44930 Transcript_20204/m.44930 type:complete len:231 (+) Transcript_20204:339-1031(+)
MINRVAWAPWEFGLVLAAASADGTVSIHEWDLSSEGPSEHPIRTAFVANEGGVNSLSWGPAVVARSLAVEDREDEQEDNPERRVRLAPKRILTGGCDNCVRLFRMENAWEEEDIFKSAHQAWVRDVAWRPCLGIPSIAWASCGDDNSVALYEQESTGQAWQLMARLQFDGPVWRISWSSTGAMLACTSPDGAVRVYAESGPRRWVVVHSNEEEEEASPGRASPGGLLAGT